MNIREKFLNAREDIENFFKRLSEQFGFGNIGNADAEQLMEMARNSPEYPHQEKLTEPEIARLLYGYLRNEHKPNKNPIRYDVLDKHLELPPGSSKKYLKEVAKNNEFRVDDETENTITLSNNNSTISFSTQKWA